MARYDTPGRARGAVPDKMHGLTEAPCSLIRRWPHQNFIYFCFQKTINRGLAHFSMPQDKLGDDRCLPRATVDRLIHDLLQKSFVISKDTKNILKESCQLFLNMIILDANRICEIENKKIITNQHVYKSLEKYGFQEYVDSCALAASNYDDYLKHRPSKQNKFKESGKTMDELHEDQMRLFSAAKKEVNLSYGIPADEESSSEEE